jgi:hypothetical protein
MKKNILWAVMIVILSALSTKSYAGANPEPYVNVIRKFIDGHMNGDFRAIREVMDGESSVIFPRGETIIREPKTDLIGEMRSQGITRQNCTSNYEVIAKSEALVLARVDFHYANATQHHFLVMEKNADKDWKIVQVYEVIDDKPTSPSPSNVLTSN